MQASPLPAQFAALAPPDPALVAKLAAYGDLVRQYSSTLDLSSPKVLDDFATAIARALTYAPYLPAGARLLDIGTGVGLPAIPLALARPDLTVVLCEVRQRRAAFLERAVGLLGLGQVTVFAKDVRHYRGQADVVTAQAVGSLASVYRLVAHCLAERWLLLSRKGEAGAAEAAALAKVAPVQTCTQVALDDGHALWVLRGGLA
jgi:16S rRNA (guanine527-N7)-methyltransferase